MRAGWLGLSLVLVACADDATKAWRTRQGELEREVAALRALDADPAGARARLADAGVAWARVSGEVDLVSMLRPLDAGVRVTADAASPDVLHLSIEGNVAACAAGLQALRPHRWLVGEWSLRAEGDVCRWDASAAPLLSALRAKLAVTPPWSPPAERAWSSVAEPKREVAALEQERAALLAKLGPVAQVSSVEERTAALEKVVAELRARAERACDEALVSRVALALPAARLDVSSTKLTEPLEPANDARLRGLVKKTDSGLEWTCVGEAAPPP